MPTKQNTALNFAETLFPVSCLLASLILFTPLFGMRLPIMPALRVHMISYLILGICFELPELSLNAWSYLTAHNAAKLRGRFSTLQSVVKVRYILTHFVGPGSGIIVVMSGLYLVYLGGYSFSTGWLFWVLVAAIFGLYKGMNQHNSYVKQLLLRTRQGGGDAQYFHGLKKSIQSPFDQICIFSEFPTYVFIYLTAYYKPAWFVNPIAGLTIFLEKMFRSPALFGLALVAAGSLFIPVLSHATRRWSCLSKIV